MRHRRTVSGRAIGIAICLVVGTGLLVVSASTSGTLSKIAADLGVVSLVVVSLATVYQTIIERDIEELLEVRSTHRDLGLRSATNDAGAYDYSTLFIDSRRLVILLNDGRTWCSHHRERFRKRFEDPRLETTIFLIHPASPMVDVLARKGDTDPGAIRAHIRECVQILESTNRNGHLEILGHFLFNPHSVVLGDDRAVVAPYFTSRGGRRVPALEYRDAGKDSYFRDLVDDFEQLRVDAVRLDAGTDALSAIGLGASERKGREHLPRSRSGRLRLDGRARESRGE